MYILAIDSTAKVATVALCKSDGKNANTLCVLGLEQLNNGNTHSETLLPMAETLLSRFSLSVSDLGLMAVDAGPGSFTGVRIGVSTVKGLAFGTNIPCVGVSTLEALANNLSPVDGILCPVMDARREQVYNALFRCKSGNICRLTPDRAVSLSELREDLQRNFAGEALWLAGDGYESTSTYLSADIAELRKTPPLYRAQNAVSVAEVGFAAYLSGKAVSDAQLFPTYLRLSQAERERNEKITANILQ